MTTFEPGQRVEVEHEGPGTVVPTEDPYSVAVEIDSDGVTVLAAPEQVSPLVEEREPTDAEIFERRGRNARTMAAAADPDLIRDRDRPGK